ncbi:MAG: hypothetical protein ISQ84_02370 [Pelagibacterales bacterium]|nr:hypothetical protein [Pelagibacterales bacterium]
MTNIIEMKLRPSDVVLDRVFNPAADDQLGGATPAQLAEACGIIPDFFCQACLMAAPLTLDNIAAGMDSVYQFGGFNAYPFKGSIDDHDGTYQSEYEDDDALPPLARFIFEGFECFVYEYGIAAIRDRATRETKIARFD